MIVGIHLLPLTNKNIKTVPNISDVKGCLVYQCYNIMVIEGVHANSTIELK